MERVASAVNPDFFPSGSALGAWLGLTPRVHSSAHSRRLGKISKRGDVYVRTLLIHGARSALIAALALRHKAPEKLDRIQHWAIQLSDRIGFNKATVALANKLARICWAMWKHGDDYNGNVAGAPRTDTFAVQ